ncbi:signal recognition particle-docking protein FtsY [bacterium]|nr:signal recognition particle-docking protein FtsY [bacterium]
MFSNLFKRSEKKETEVPQEELTSKEETAEDTEETTDTSESPNASETQEKTGGLKGLWEKTRKLAATPVDPWFSKMAQGLDKTRQQFVGRITNLFTSSGKIDNQFWEELEDILLTADVGLAATTNIIDKLKEEKLSDPQLLRQKIKAVIGEILKGNHSDNLVIDPDRLNVIMMVGVNGTGKTTTTAKLAYLFKTRGYKVLLAAADTFRAAAIDQLQIWADKVGVELVRHQEGSDPGAVVFDAIESAKARKCNIVLIDTAGRLHNKFNLMEELSKIRRVADKAYKGAPHETLLVLDATTGQNALEQAKVFNKSTELTGLVMCKLDGTGKGGVVVALGQEFNLPVRYIGVGEAVDDLREFNAEQFLEALFADPASFKDVERDLQSKESEKEEDEEQG